jgi:Flp pilus assembly protein TadG
MILEPRKLDVEAKDQGSRQRRVRRLGAAVVEFAILAPFLFFLMVGMFELARGIMIKQMLNDAARKACRTGVEPNKTNTDITNEINNILQDNGFSSGIATITILVGAEGTAPVGGTAADASTARPGLDFVSVKVGIPVSSISWCGTFFLPGSTVESETVYMMRQE